MTLGRHRSRLQQRAVLIVCLLGACTPGSYRTDANATPNRDEQIWTRLRQNTPGYIVMMRHAEAPGIGDPPNFRLNDCSTQRNLSPAGKAQAARIGQIFRQRGVRVAQVLSSQWCRCLDTAKLLDLGQVKPFPALNSFFQNRQTESRKTAAIRQLIRQNQQTSGVVLLVTHQVNITAVSDLSPRSGESVVLRSDNQGRIEVVGLLPPP